MSFKYYLPFLFLVHSYSFADEIKNTQPIFFEKKPEIKPDLLITPEKNNLSIGISDMDVDPSECINLSILKKDWNSLDICLARYKKTDNYDEILYQYGLGALYYNKGNRNKAIELYQSLLYKNPDLTYPRFDLAMMLFQDQRYKEAKSEFETVKKTLTPQMQTLVNQILLTINRSEKWNTALNFNYEKTDNVNQASDLKIITIGNATFIRSEEDLPQKAEGSGYNINLSKDTNISKNNYINISATIDGLYYWDNKDYNEQTYRLDIGYKNKNFKRTWGITPFIEQNELGNEPYNSNYGITFDFNTKISDKYQLSTNLSHIKRKYRDETLSEIYNGYTNSQVALMIYQPKLNFILYSGLDAMQDHLKDKSESSQSTGLRFGTIHTNNFLNIRADLRYANRNFEDENFWYNEKRKDKIYETTVTVWQNKIQWKNFTPKLNYKYQNIDSNLELYTRNNSSFFLTIDKTF